MRRDIDHIREIEATQSGGNPGRDPVVVESWLRCLDKHKLNPAARSEAYILPESALRQHRQRSEELIRIATSGIDDLYRIVAGQDYVLLLSDADGVTVEYLGEDRHKAELRRSGLYLGAEWSEARAGTCALGACIEAQEALIIHQDDHFDVSHIGLSCTAAPIFDTSGRLAAVLDISLLASPIARASQYLALNLVRQTVRRIEMANIMAESRNDWVLRLAASPEFLDVDPEAALRLDPTGHVIGMTHGAARLMARNLGESWQLSTSAKNPLIGRHISEIFETDLAGLEGLTRAHAPKDRLIGTRDGHRLFAHAIEPQRESRRPLARPQPIPPQLRELAGEDPSLQALISRAAAMARGAAPILIEGPVGSGKSTLARSLHEIGRRGPCITLDCAGFDESEAAVLFGQSGPRGHQKGLIDQATGGSLIFETIEELPARLQARLVSLLHEGRYRPISALSERSTDARLIFTCSDLNAPGLREDLRRRLIASRLMLPALTARQDLLSLIRRTCRRRSGADLSFDGPASTALTAYAWPGNYHELEAFASSLTSSDRALSLTDLPPEMTGRSVAPGRSPEAQQLAMVLLQTGWNISAAARQLGLDRSTVHRQILRYRLMREES